MKISFSNRHFMKLQELQSSPAAAAILGEPTEYISPKNSNLVQVQKVRTKTETPVEKTALRSFPFFFHEGHVLEEQQSFKNPYHLRSPWVKALGLHVCCIPLSLFLDQICTLPPALVHQSIVHLHCSNRIRQV